MDMRGPESRDPDALVAITSEALDLLSAAKQGFGELVTSHLTSLWAVDELKRHYVLDHRAYASTFAGAERSNPMYLACHLIWAATMIRLARDARAIGRPLDRSSARHVAWLAQKRFLEAFDDPEEWIESMRPEGESD